jgi:hypothetical protein
MGVSCDDRDLDGPASGDKGSKGRNELNCIRGKGVRPVGSSHWISTCALPFGVYRGTSLIRKRRPLGTFSKPMPRALWWSYGGVRFLMSGVTL